MKITTVPGFFGEFVHKDEDGNKVGETWPGPFPDSYVHYDRDGERTGLSLTNAAEQLDHYNASGERTAQSVFEPDFSMSHWKSGEQIGNTTFDFLELDTDLWDDPW